MKRRRGRDPSCASPSSPSKDTLGFWRTNDNKLMMMVLQGVVLVVCSSWCLAQADPLRSIRAHNKVEVSEEPSRQRPLLMHQPLNTSTGYESYLESVRLLPVAARAGDGEDWLWRGDTNSSPHQHPMLATIMSVSFLVGIIIFILVWMS